MQILYHCRTGRPGLPALLLLALLPAGSAFAEDLTPRKKDTPETKEFQSRVDNYLKLRKGAVASVPKLKDKAEPEEIEAHRKAELQAIRNARTNAKQGDLFTPEMEQSIKQVIRSEIKGPAGRAVQQTSKGGNPVRDREVPETPVTLKVNAAYPEKAPLSTVPPTLLLRLPTLPKELDFRFVGHNLILRDVGAGMIVDYILNAMP
jgi:hypothetical protein